MIFNHMLDDLCIHICIIGIVLCKYTHSATTEINVYIAVVVSTSSFLNLSGSLEWVPTRDAFVHNSLLSFTDWCASVNSSAGRQKKSAPKASGDTSIFINERWRSTKGGSSIVWMVSNEEAMFGDGKSAVGFRWLLQTLFQS